MKVKNLIIFGFFILLANVLRAQSFYQIDWESDNIKYNAFIVYYDLNNILVRVKYKDQNQVYKVAEYKCKGSYYNTSDGKKHFLYDGSDAKIVYPLNYSEKLGYSADNFIFSNIDANNQFKDLYTIDDAQLKKEDYTNYYKKATFKELKPKNDFSLQYLKNYFEENESLYKTLVANYIESKSSSSGTGNYQISSLSNGGTEWKVVMSKGTKFNEQTWHAGSEYPTEWIRQKWDEGYRITSVGYVSGEWAVSMSKGSGITMQTHCKLSSTYPGDWIKEKWNEDYYISSVAYGAGGWNVVMSKGLGFTTQSHSGLSSSYPSDWIRKKWGEDFYITSVSYGAGSWNVVMSKGAGYSTQSHSGISSTYPTDWIKTKWSDGLDITSVAYGAEGWNVVMSKGLNYTQTYQTSTTFPSSWIKSKWDGTVANPENGSGSVTIHLITVADTYDPSIGRSCQNDMNSVNNILEKIKSELNVKLNTVSISGNDLTKEMIQRKINNLSVSSSDVILFYYSGHGYNEDSRSSDFPFMALNGPDYKLEDVYNSLRSKGARLSLTIGDLCNSVLTTRSGTGRSGEIAFRSSPNFDFQKLSRLFLQARGNLISTSSGYNEWSYSLPDGSGDGAFTKSFIASLLKEASVISGSPGDWKNIFTSAYSATYYNTSHLLNKNNQYGQHGFNRGTISY